jgi:predicted N-acetyltransferase YhbS
MQKLAERIHRVLVADLSLGNRTLRTDHAVVVANPEFPLLPEANLVHSVRMAAATTADGLLEEVEPALAAARSPWRHVIVDPGTRPEGLGEMLQRAGFEARARVGAAYLSAPTADVDRKVVVRAIADASAWAEFRSLRRRIQAVEGRAAQELEQQATLARRRGGSSNMRFYLALTEFEPVGHVGLLSVGRTGLIVDLAVLPERRRKGTARAMIRRMVEQSRELGHDLTCVIHDDRPELAGLFAGQGFSPSARFISWLARRSA